MSVFQEYAFDDWEEGRREAVQNVALIKSSADFVSGFVPPDYLWDGVLQRRYLYSFTARTNSGKTALMLTLAAHTGLGRPAGNRVVERGKVLFLSGENPDDVRMRWIAMAQQMDFRVEDVDVYFVAGRFKISEMKAVIGEEIKTNLGGVALVLVDTSAAYFEGDDENDNRQAIEWAVLLRSLTELPGGPCVVVACHPTKNASDDNLIPRGGGGFLAEVDGNLTAKRTDNKVELHWQGKFRGPDFAPWSFQLRNVTHELLKDSKGRLLPTVVALPLSEAAEQEMTRAQRQHEDALLKVLAEYPTASQAELATRLNWSIKGGQPHKTRVRRTLKSLEQERLIKKDRDGYILTEAGEKTLGKGSAPEHGCSGPVSKSAPEGSEQGSSSGVFR